jgi:hypothetical protein
VQKWFPVSSCTSFAQQSTFHLLYNTTGISAHKHTHSAIAGSTNNPACFNLEAQNEQTINCLTRHLTRTYELHVAVCTARAYAVCTAHRHYCTRRTATNRSSIMACVSVCPSKRMTGSTAQQHGLHPSSIDAQQGAHARSVSVESLFRSAG